MQINPACSGGLALWLQNPFCTPYHSEVSTTLSCLESGLENSVDDLLNYFQVSNHAVRGEMSRISFGRHGPHK